MLVPYPGQLIDTRVIPIHALEGIQVGIVGFLGVCGRCPTPLEGVVPRLHPGFVRNQSTSGVWVSEALLLFPDREFPQFTPGWQIIKRQIRLDRKQGDNRACRCLTEHTPTGVGSIVQILHLGLPGKWIRTLPSREGAKHDWPTTVYRD
ncbi:MAG TPA: hypothetical protein EYN87_08825, partial [Gammaproteobacteria bacterium]|nr:hypothetical protein [Gammaproteobacteria bacterium]